MAKVSIGDVAPGFALPATDGTQVRLADLRGAPVVLAFFPGGSTCRRQMCQYTERWDELTGAGARIVGISVLGVERNRRFAEKNSIEVPLLSDDDGSIARAYGVWQPGKIARAVFLLDAGGVVRWRWVSRTTIGFPRGEALAERVRSLG